MISNVMVKGELDKKIAELHREMELLRLENQELAVTNSHLVSATWREREFKQQLQLANDQLHESKQLIEKQNGLIKDSINYAHRIQSAIIPSTRLIKKHFKNSSILFRPKDTLSGDFPWFYSKVKDFYVGAVDCTGHGVPGAMLSLIGNFKLNEIVQLGKLEPADVLNLLHSEVQKTLQQDDASDVRDGMDVALCRIDYTKGEFSFAGAHRPLLILDGNEITEVKGDRRPIGGKPLGNKPWQPFVNHKMELKRGTRMFIYSDGLPDQLNEDDTMKFSNKRIRDIITAHADQPVKTIVSEVEQELKTWMTNAHQLDDILLIGFEI